MSQSLSRTVTVLNKAGLHARPADLLVRIAKQYQSEILVGKGSETVDAESILSLLTLGAAQGTELSIKTTGSDAQEALDAICELFASGFADSAVDSQDD